MKHFIKAFIACALFVSLAMAGTWMGLNALSYSFDRFGFLATTAILIVLLSAIPAAFYAFHRAKCG